MTTEPLSPDNPETAFCGCSDCGRLYRVICTGYGEPDTAFCVDCGGGLAVWNPASWADREAWRVNMGHGPALELRVPRETEDTVVALHVGRHALRVAAALDAFAFYGDDAARADAVRWRERAQRDGILPAATPVGAPTH